MERPQLYITTTLPIVGMDSALSFTTWAAVDKLFTFFKPLSSLLQNRKTINLNYYKIR